MNAKYTEGTKVVIVNRFNKATMSEEMRRYLGTVMTIRSVGETGNSVFPYRMVEDKGVDRTEGWYWDDAMIDHEATARLHNGETAKSEPEPEEHPHTPFHPVELQMVIVASHGIIVYGCGSGKFVAPGVYCGSATGDDGRWKMVFHVVALGV